MYQSTFLLCKILYLRFIESSYCKMIQWRKVSDNLAWLYPNLGACNNLFMFKVIIEIVQENFFKVFFYNLGQ